MSGGYSPSEERALVRSLARAGAAARCPRCRSPLDRHDVPPREGVPYVRRRVQVVCTGCRASVALDRRAIERAREGDG